MKKYEYEKISIMRDSERDRLRFINKKIEDALKSTETVDDVVFNNLLADRTWHYGAYTALEGVLSAFEIDE